MQILARIQHDARSSSTRDDHTNSQTWSVPLPGVSRKVELVSHCQEWDATSLSVNNYRRSIRKAPDRPSRHIPCMPDSSWADSIFTHSDGPSRRWHPVNQKHSDSLGDFFFLRWLIDCIFPSFLLSFSSHENRPVCPARITRRRRIRLEGVGSALPSLATATTRQGMEFVHLILPECSVPGTSGLGTSTDNQRMSWRRGC